MLKNTVMVFFLIEINFFKGLYLTSSSLISGFNTTCIECGDHCLEDVLSFSLCHCGNEIFHPHTSFKHCCIPSNTTCYTESSYPYNVVCREGKVKPMYISCGNSERSLQCFNSYQDNKKIDRLFSHYTCPQICVPSTKMCHGANWCKNDEEECGPNLQCFDDGKDFFKHLIIAPEHRFCPTSKSYFEKFDSGRQNNGEYDKIDRSDENLSKFWRAESYINITEFMPCIQKRGIMEVYERNGSKSYQLTNNTFSIQYMKHYTKFKILDKGLTCGTECLTSSKWCLPDTSNMLVPVDIGNSMRCGNDKIREALINTFL